MKKFGTKAMSFSLMTLAVAACLTALAACGGEDPAEGRITSVLSKTTYSCSQCYREEYAWGMDMRQEMLRGFNAMVNHLGSDLKIEPQKISLEFKAESDSLDFTDGHLAIGIDRAALTEDAYPWILQKSLKVAAEAWTLGRFRGDGSLHWTIQLAEAASMMTLYGEKATCRYFSGVVVGPNLLVKELCDSGLITADRLWAMARELSAATAGLEDKLTKQEYVGLWLKHFGQGAVGPLCRSGLLQP